MKKQNTFTEKQLMSFLKEITKPTNKYPRYFWKGGLKFKITPKKKSVLCEDNKYHKISDKQFTEITGFKA